MIAVLLAFFGAARSKSGKHHVPLHALGVVAVVVVVVLVRDALRQAPPHALEFVVILVAA
jgi:hypothetical protein